MSDQENARGGGNRDAASGGADALGKRSRRSCGGDGGGFNMDAWWEDRSLPEKIILGIGFGILAIGLIALCGWVVMLLWNWLMPEIFGLKTLNYWQAWGLLALSTILFKGFGSGGSGGKSDRRRKKHLRRYIREEQPPNGKK
jgi:hypothetical protein